MKYAIGLDVGVASVGWSVLELSGEERPIRIVDLGVRIFEKAEQPKTGASLALPRREARSQRRRIRRRKHRKERIYNLLLSCGVLTLQEKASLYDGNLSDVYGLRVKALDYPLNNYEFARVLIHLSQRRGFKSNRKSVDESDKANGKLLEAVGDNVKKMKEGHYRTVGEMLFLDDSYAEQKRNKGEDYKNTVSRDLIENEAKAIFSAQRKLGVSFASEEIEQKYLEILLSQRSFAQGPGSGPYSGNQVERMIGKCTLEDGEKRCSKATYSFQLFSLWQRINHLKINTLTEARHLNDDERREIFKYAHEHENFTYHHLRKLLGEAMKETDTFVGIRYDDDVKKSESAKKIKDLSVYHEIRKNLDKLSKEHFSKLTHEQLDKIGEAFSKNLSDEEILAELSECGFEESVSEQLLKLPNFSKYSHVSVTAARKLLPYLESGLTYDKACEMAGYDFKGGQKQKSKFLPPLEQDSEITNPVVKRAISQTIKVINAIIRKMGEISPVYLNIELARELSKSLEERRKIEKSYEENAKVNESIVEQIRSCGVLNPTGQDIVKFKLWNEQAGICPYSQQYISKERLFEPGYVDVDHIVPYSRSFDDRLTNKVLVKSAENRQKGNLLPLEYLAGKKKEDFIVWVNTQNYKRAKKELLLKEKLTDEEGWKQRHLQDTQFISSFLHNYISSKLEFASNSKNKKRSVVSVNGVVTAYVRKRWGINKVRANGDLHHAVDAVVVGCISQGMINDIQRHSYYKETYECGAYKVDPETGEALEKFPVPWRHFLNELNIRTEANAQNMRKMLFDVNYQEYSEIDLNDIKPPFVSKMSNHKVTGSAHLQTVKGKKSMDGNKSLLISKVDIKKLKLGSDGEIEKYYNPSSDKLLYEALKKRLLAYDNDGEKAFADPFFKPCADGSKGPLVKKVKICEVSSLCVDVQEKTAVASNETMVRCDVYHVENDGYYFVPVYVADTVKKELPNKACVAGKRPWKEMQESDFIFSLYPNDLIKYYSNKKIVLANKMKGSSLPSRKEIDGEEGVFLYYKGLDISVAVLSGITHEGVYEIRSIGKTSARLEKYEVDVLGNYRRVEKEKRRDFNFKK